MVRLAVHIKAELENVTGLQPAHDDYEWFFNITCTNCYEPHPKPVSINRFEKRQLSTGKHNDANLVWKCGQCKREASASFDVFDTKTGYIKTYDAEHAESGSFAPIAVLECRGLDLTAFIPKGIWKCRGAESGTIFDEVDLDEGEWTEYDEKARQPVGITEIQSEIKRAK
ncbi:hypothetical protein FRC03_012687 [Tulasnella sp. 419]|nr:hypothetical protein FRC02_006443 [Tulasnella sp. 418]KAG8950961.1 hypothetical protein FRC03_012687 [Tulasnella sp. 419]